MRVQKLDSCGHDSSCVLAHSSLDFPGLQKLSALFSQTWILSSITHDIGWEERIGEVRNDRVGTNLPCKNENHLFMWDLGDP